MLIITYEKNGAYGRLLALVVDESARGRGIGTALVEKAEQWLVERGATAVVVNSGHHRSEAHRFYKRLRYEETGVRFMKSLPPRTERYPLRGTPIRYVDPFESVIEDV